MGFGARGELCLKVITLGLLKAARAVLFLVSALPLETTDIGYEGNLMKITRRFTEAGKSPYETIAFRRALSEIKNPDGSVVFRLDGFEVPEAWSQVAADILAQKYFRKAGVPRRLKKVEENQVPSWLWRSVADTAALSQLPEAERFGGETDARQVFDRLAGTWTYWGWKGGYFTSEEDAEAFFDEMRYMLAMQMAARTRRSGSTPVCTGHTASMVRARATSMSTTRRANSPFRSPPTNTPSRTPASSSRSKTIS